jgi:exodeoxyribonuclease V alpha subunit
MAGRRRGGGPPGGHGPGGARAARAAGGAQAESHGEGLANDYARLSGGDASWLQPQPHVGALRDAVVRLRVSYRFGARPGIGALARATQEGNADEVLAVLADDTFADVSLDVALERRASVSAATAERMLGPLVPWLQAYLDTSAPAAALDALGRFRLLCALREGEHGVTGLNTLVEQWLVREGRSVDGWYDHRPVLITANDAGMRLFNGDVGMTLAVDGVPMVHFPLPGGGVRSLPPARLPAHETAWAMTVHKAQGSEATSVVVSLPPVPHPLANRELVYTAVTRARERLLLIGDADLLATARASREQRCTWSAGLLPRPARGAPAPR